MKKKMSENEVFESQPLMTHLVEFRNRVLRSVLAVLIIFAGLFSFSNEIYLYISEPIRVFLPANTSMIATEVASPFLTPFKLTLVLSVFAAMPFILYQTWAFLAPGLYKREKKLSCHYFSLSCFYFMPEWPLPITWFSL